MLKVGIAGIGFMGWIHWLAYQKVPGVMVAAKVRDERRAEGRILARGGAGPANDGGNPPGAHPDLWGKQL